MEQISNREKGRALSETLPGEPSLKPLLLTIPQAARLLGLSRAKLYRMMQCGELPVVRIGRAVRLSYTSLERWIEQREHPSQGDDVDLTSVTSLFHPRSGVKARNQMHPVHTPASRPERKSGRPLLKGK